MGTRATCGRIIEHGIYHSKKPETSLPARDMQPQCKAGRHSGEREGREMKREKKGKMLVTIKSRKSTQTSLTISIQKSTEEFLNALIFTNFCRLKIQPKYLPQTKINLVEGQYTSMWL